MPNKSERLNGSFSELEQCYPS